jgi:AcrR family transcriptional regulator
MPRSGEEARRRLQQAALELYLERGYDATTTAQIAERAGVTERTFFRHFADKREVFFDGEAVLRSALITAIAKAPEDLGPLPVLLRRTTNYSPDTGQQVTRGSHRPRPPGVSGANRRGCPIGGSPIEAPLRSLNRAFRLPQPPRPRPGRQAAGLYVYASPALGGFGERPGKRTGSKSRHRAPGRLNHGSGCATRSATAPAPRSG